MKVKCPFELAKECGWKVGVGVPVSVKDAQTAVRFGATRLSLHSPDGETASLSKDGDEWVLRMGRRYLKPGQKPPKGAKVQKGKRGGMYYETGGTGGSAKPPGDYQRVIDGLKKEAMGSDKLGIDFTISNLGSEVAEMNTRDARKVGKAFGMKFKKGADSGDIAVAIKKKVRDIQHINNFRKPEERTIERWTSPVKEDKDNIGDLDAAKFRYPQGRGDT